LGWSTGAFLASYLDNRAAANTAALDESILAPLIVALMTGQDSWQGTAKDLLTELEAKADDKTRKRKDWPSTPRKLSGDLRRLAPNLRRGAGLEVRFDRHPGKAHRRMVCLERIDKRPSEPSDTVRKAPVEADGRTVSDGTLHTQSSVATDEEIVEWTA
jgi:hypothetical protein